MTTPTVTNSIPTVTNTSTNTDAPVEWCDGGTCWLNQSPQLSPRWYECRVGRISASKAHALLCPDNFNPLAKTIEAIVTLPGQAKTYQDDAKLMLLAEHGIKTEPEARSWYERTRSVQVREVGLAVYKLNPYLGASSDGDVIDATGKMVGLIEIKCPQVMYRPLEEHMHRQSRSTTAPVNNYNHIRTSHYYQMQMNMAIRGAQWCDYIVYCTPENKAFVQRIPYDEQLWTGQLYPALVHALNTHILPRLAGTKYPIMPPGSELSESSSPESST